MSKTTPTARQLPAAPVAVTPPKHYDEGFKRQAVEHWLGTGLPGTRIARDLGVSYPSLKEWKRRYQGAALPGHADLSAENRALKA